MLCLIIVIYKHRHAKSTTGSSQGLKQEQLPVPQLVTEQVVATLQRLGVEVKLCEGEADPDLAYCSREGSETLKVRARAPVSRLFRVLGGPLLGETLRIYTTHSGAQPFMRF